MRKRALSFLTCLCLAVLAVGAEGEGDDGVARGDDATKDDFPEELVEEVNRQQVAALATAEAHHLKALALYKKSHFADALEEVEKAIDAFPSHRRARELRSKIKAMLGVRGARLDAFIKYVGDLGDVATQEGAIRLAKLIKEGDRKLDRGDFHEALRAYDDVAVSLRTFPYEFDWGDLPETIKKKKLQAMAMAREADLKRQQRALERANELARQENRRREDMLRVRVDKILARAQRAFRRGKFKRAAVDALYAYKMDRRREDARSLYRRARRVAHATFDDWYMRELPERRARINERIHEHLIPQDELLVYPGHWDLIDQREVAELGEQVEEAWRIEMEKRLEQEVTFIWEDQQLEEAIEYLRRTTGINMIIDPEALATAPPPITLEATNMKLQTALKWIQRITNLTASIRGQAIFLSNEEVRGEVVVKPYDVTDLMIPVEDFEGPDLTFDAGGAGGGGGGGFDIFQDAGGAGGAAEGDPAEIADFIRNNIEPDSWGGPGGASIEPRRGGTLFISQAPEVHDRIEQILRTLRKQKGLQVNIRVRILDLTKAFIEEIGIDFEDISGGLLASTTNSGMDTVGGITSGFFRSTNQLPGSAAVTQIPTGAGMAIESSYNLNGLFNTPQINAVLRALELENDSIILNAPELTCYNGQRAVYMFLHQFAYIQDYQLDSGGDGVRATYDPVIQILNLGEVIDVRPLVSADRKYITMEMRPTSRLLRDVFVENINAITEVQDDVVVPAQFPIELPNIEVRTLRTTITMPDKGSMLLGGYTRGLRQRMHSGIPFLSHIPFLGRLFSRNGLYDENRRLYFLVTATILDLNEIEAMQ